MQLCTPRNHFILTNSIKKYTYKVDSFKVFATREYAPSTDSFGVLVSGWSECCSEFRFGSCEIGGVGVGIGLPGNASI